MNERGADRGELEEARQEYLDRERWRFFLHGHFLVGRFWKEQSVIIYI